MFVWIWFLLIIIGIDGLFVERGDYTDYQRFGVNLPECGFTFKPMVSNISFEKRCFLNEAPSINVVEGKQDDFHKITNRIFKGRKALLNESPWTIMLTISNDEGFKVCTGSLITFEWLLTAAHCFDNNPYSVMFFGGSSLIKDMKILTITLANILVHPFYTHPNSVSLTQNENITKMQYDIALVKLDSEYGPIVSEVNQQYEVNTICLPTTGPLNANEEFGIMAGFGVVDVEGTLPTVLQMANKTLIAHTSCSVQLVLCTDTQLQKSKGCPGDSGGPLYQFTNKTGPRAILAGVYKGGTGDCNGEASIDYWVPVMRFMDWILDIITKF